MKIKSNWDNELPLNQTIDISIMIIVVRAVFLKMTNVIQKNDQYIYINDLYNVYIMSISYIMIELMFLKILVLIKQMHHYWYFLNKWFKCPPYVCDRCHDLLMFINHNDITILKIKNAENRCIITGISKGEAMKLLQNIDFTEKRDIIKLNIKSNFGSLSLLQTLI